MIANMKFMAEMRMTHFMNLTIKTLDPHCERGVQNTAPEVAGSQSRLQVEIISLSSVLAEMGWQTCLNRLSFAAVQSARERGIMDILQ
jgi:hypothetical protein